MGERRALGIMSSEIPSPAEKLKFFGSNYLPDDDDSDDDSLISSTETPGLPTIELPETSPGFFDPLGEDSSLVNEIFETLKMKKQVSSASIDSSNPSSTTKTPLDIDSASSPSVTATSPNVTATQHQPLRNTDSYGANTDDVFAEKKLSATTSKTSVSKLSPDASPPTLGRPISPRMRSAYPELPRVPPEIIKPLADVTVSSGCLVTLECSFALPIPDSIEWFRNNEQVQSNHSIAFKNDSESGSVSLSILSVIPLDEGIYEVVGKNVLGSIHSSAFLKVDGEFRVLSILKLLNILMFFNI